MYNIAICDDEPVFSVDLRKTVQFILLQNNIKAQIDIYNDYHIMLQAINNKKKKYHLLILDILTDKMNGVTFAHLLRSNQIMTPILFVTSTSAFSLEGYNVNALNYLLKPVSEDELRPILLANYVKEVEHKYLRIKEGAAVHQLKLSNISHIETKGRKSAIFSDGKEVIVRSKIAVLQEILEAPYFIRCHQSFIVNLNHVEEIKYRKISLNNGKEIPISRPYQADVQKYFLALLGQPI